MMTDAGWPKEIGCGVSDCSKCTAAVRLPVEVMLCLSHAAWVPVGCFGYCLFSVGKRVVTSAMFCNPVSVFFSLSTFFLAYCSRPRRCGCKRYRSCLAMLARTQTCFPSSLKVAVCERLAVGNCCGQHQGLFAGVIPPARS